MAKFLNYEDWPEIKNGLKKHMTFTQIGEKLGRDRTTITKEIRNYSLERDTGYGKSALRRLFFVCFVLFITGKKLFRAIQ